MGYQAIAWTRHRTSHYLKFFFMMRAFEQSNSFAGQRLPLESVYC